MRRSHANRRFRPFLTLGLVVVLGTILGGDLAAGELSPRDFPAARPLPYRGRFFGPTTPPRPFPTPDVFPFPIPNRDPFPFPNPILPDPLLELRVTGPIDRCLVNSPSIDPGSLRTLATGEIDPGIFATPRVQGLSIRPSGSWPR